MFAFHLDRRPTRRLGRGVETRHVRVASVAAAVVTVVTTIALPLAEADAKTPGARYCFLGTCHRVMTLAETRALVGKTETVVASHYDDAARDRFNPRNITSSGEMFRSHMPDNAASPIYPDGTKLLVWHAPTRQAVIVRINNAGPYWGKRKLDLSRAAAEKLGFAKQGVATVHVHVLEAPTAAEATYRRGRTYPPVPGFIGAFADLGQATSGARIALGVRAPAAVAVASLTYDAPAVRLEANAPVPPTEMGEFALVASSSPPTEIEPARQPLGPTPAIVMAAAALAAPFVPIPEPKLRVGTAVALQPPRLPGRIVKSAVQAPAKIVPSRAKPAPIKVAMSVGAVHRPTAARAPAPLVNQPARISAAAPPRREPAMVDAGQAEDSGWIPLALDGKH
jgi:rare lipoprotein A (peptidoglycan hydrolase)